MGTAGAARVSMSDGEREREREIGEGERDEGANQSRCDYMRVFLQMFTTKVPCGMPSQLRLLTWRVWDLG